METITKKELSRMPLKGKPKCPHCNIPLNFIYEGSTGFSGEKCKRCNQEYLVNTETLEVIKVEKAS